MRFWLPLNAPRSWANLLEIGRETPQGVELQLRVTPRGGKNAITGERGGMLLLSVRAAPADGEANAAVLQTLSDVLKIAKGRIQIVRGEKSREKWVRVSGASLDDIRDILIESIPALASR